MTPLAPTPDSARQAWRQALPLFLLLLATALLLFQDTAQAMVLIWLRSDTFTHGFLVPPIVLWLVWRRRTLLAGLMPQPSRWAMLALALAAFAWLLGDLVAVNAVTQLALVSMLVLLVPAVLGLAVARAISFALVFLFFAVPLGEFAMPQLMIWTADFTVLALRASGVAVLREGLQFVIPSGSWSVVEACSGVRYLIASLTVGILFAYLNYQSTQRRVLFILVSIAVPIVANWVRAYMIVMLGHLSGNTLAAGVDHLIYGWVFFGIVIMLMFMIGARWSEPESDPLARLGSHAQTNPASHVAKHAGYAAQHGLAALALLLLLALPQGLRQVIDASDRAAPPQLVSPAALSAAWTAAPAQIADFKPAFHNPSAAVNTTYQSQGMQVGLYLGYYRQQNYNRKLVSSDNVLVKSSDLLWAQVSTGSDGVDWAGQPQRVRRAELRGSPLSGQAAGVRLRVWQIYWVNGIWTASDAMAKLYGALQRLLGRGDDAAVLILYTGQSGGGDAALAAFAAANAPALTAWLEQTRAQR